MTRRPNMWAYGLLLPALAVFVLFYIWPNLEIFYLSFFNWSGISPQKTFIGLTNYRALLDDDLFMFSLRNTALIAAVSVFVQIPIAIGLALALERPTRTNRALSAVIFLPIVISLAATALIWTWLLDPSFGAVNWALEAVGLDAWARAWLAEPQTAFPTILFVTNWVYIGLYMVLFIAGLKAIPRNLYDAAKVDGLSRVQTALQVSVPLLREVIVVALILAITGSFKAFDLIWIMTGGGPASATEVAPTVIYKTAFRRLQSGYAASQAVVVFLVALSLVLVQLRVTRAREA